MTQYIIAPEAIQDLKIITDYLAKTNLTTAEKLLRSHAKITS